MQDDLAPQQQPQVIKVPFSEVRASVAVMNKEQLVAFWNAGQVPTTRPDNFDESGALKEIVKQTRIFAKKLALANAKLADEQATVATLTNKVTALQYNEQVDHHPEFSYRVLCSSSHTFPCTSPSTDTDTDR
jgi:hypothetical protein